MNQIFKAMMLHLFHLTRRFSILRSKTKPQKSDVEALDNPIPDKMNNAADVGCETSSGIKELAGQGR